MLYQRYKAVVNAALSNSLLLIAIALIAIHTSLFSYYLKQDYSVEVIKAKRQVNHQIFALIVKAANNMSPASFEKLLQQQKNYNIQIGPYKVNLTLSDKPRFQPVTDFREVDSNYLSSLSANLYHRYWLNYDVSEIHNYYEFSLISSLIELGLMGLYLFYSFSLQRFKVPLLNFKSSAQRLGVDINAPPLKILGPNIVRETANAMNQMQQRIQDLINTRTKMLAAISHDLRTPITRLRLRAQFIDDSAQAKKIVDDLVEMERMIDSILNFSSEDMLREQKAIFDINSLLLTVCENFSDQGFEVHISAHEGHIAFFGAPHALKRVFTNLIQNAIKYGKKVRVELTLIQNSIAIIIEDNGPGIPESELKKVFEPYYRSQSAKRIAPGNGLGLSIAYEIIKAHGSTIDLHNLEQGGLQVKIVLPHNVQDNYSSNLPQ